MKIGIRNILILGSIFTFACAVLAQDAVLPQIEGTNTFKISDITFNSPAIAPDPMIVYGKTVAENLRKNWDKEKIFANTDDHTLVLLTIKKDGTVTDSKIIYYSKDEKLNNSVRDYIKTINKVEPLPELYKNNSYAMSMYFGKRLNTNTDTVDFNAYMQNIQKTIKENWSVTNIPKNASKNVSVLFSIKKDGMLAYAPKILTSSGDAQYDDSCLNAIRTIGKFAPLPKEFNGELIDIQFTFNMHVWRDVWKNQPNESYKSYVNNNDYVEKGYQSFADDYKIMNKNLFIRRDNIVYLKLIKDNDSNNYKTYKIDCSGGQLGHTYTYNPFSRIIYSDIKMSFPRKNSLDEQVFSYACKT